MSVRKTLRPRVREISPVYLWWSLRWKRLKEEMCFKSRGGDDSVDPICVELWDGERPDCGWGSRNMVVPFANRYPVVIIEGVDVGIAIYKWTDWLMSPCDILYSLFLGLLISAKLCSKPVTGLTSSIHLQADRSVSVSSLLHTYECDGFQVRIRHFYQNLSDSNFLFRSYSRIINVNRCGCYSRHNCDILRPFLGVWQALPPP